MNKETHKKLALEDLMARAEQRAGDKKAYKNVYVEPLGGELTVEKIPLPRVLSMVDGMNGASMMEDLEFQASVIYACCPVLREPALRDAYGVETVTDLVRALFEDNMGAISLVSETILDFYGMADNKDAVKNTVKN